MCCLLLAQVLVNSSSTLLHHLKVTSLLFSKCLILIFLKIFIIPTRDFTGPGLPCIGKLGSAVVLSAHFSLFWDPCPCLHSNPKACRLLPWISAYFMGFYVQPAGLPCEGKIRNLCPHGYWGILIYSFVVMCLAIKFCLIFRVYRNQKRQWCTSDTIKFIIEVHRCLHANLQLSWKAFVLLYDVSCRVTQMCVQYQPYRDFLP